MAKILGISGSPHADGNTAYAVRYALEQCGGDHETRYLSLSGRSVAPCSGCFSCAKTGRCHVEDGMTEVYEALRWCDALVLGSPVHMGMVSGQMKCLMDRTVALRPGYGEDMAMEGKVGCGIACGWFRNGGQETALQNMATFFLQQGMSAISDGRPYSHAGGTIVGVAGEDPLGLETIRNLMQNLFRTLARR